MKKKLMVILTLIVMLSLLGMSLSAVQIYDDDAVSKTVTVVEKTADSLTVRFMLPDLSVEDVYYDAFGKGTRFSVSGGDVHYGVGMPDVPVIRHKIQVPDTGGVSVAIMSEETQYLGNYRIAPLQHAQTLDNAEYPYVINDTVYATDATYPAQCAVVDSVQILRDIRVADVVFSPVRVNPSTGETYLIKTAIVTLSFTKERGTNELQKAHNGLTKSYIPFYRDVLLLDDSLLQRNAGTVGCYVFIGNDASLNAVRDLINWKKMKGYDVVEANVAAIGGTASQIDAYLENAYNTWPNPPEFVLLVGGETIIPTFQTSSQRKEADNKFGVVGSGNTPSIHVGRITAKNGDMSNLTYQAWKIINYEQDVLDGDWLTQGETWGCSNPNGAPTANEWADILRSAGLTVNVELEAQGGAKGSTLVQHFNNGLSTFAMKGHGNQTSWASASINVGMAGTFANGRKFPWINNIACLNSNFSGRYCFSESLMCEGSIVDPKGAVGMFSFSVSSSVGGSDTLLINIYKALYQNGVYKVGAASDYGKSTCSNAEDVNGGMLWGCPEMELYSVSPVPNLAVTQTTAGDGRVNISVTDGSGPVDDAMVGIVKKATYEKVTAGYTDTSGNLTLDLGAASGDMTLTVTAHNCKPYIGDLQAGPTPTPTPPPVKNLALNKPIISSSNFSNDFSKEQANDGDENTVWGAALNDKTPYLYVDLGKECSLESIIIKWYDGYFASRYYIGVMIDGTWVTAQVTGDGFIDTHQIGQHNITSRYVGIMCLKGPQSAYGIRELEVMGND